MDKEELKTKNIPQEAGIYLARLSEKYQWYRYIVEVTGEAPMLKANWVWDQLNEKLYKGFDATKDVYWGPKLDIPAVPDEEILR